MAQAECVKKSKSVPEETLNLIKKRLKAL